MTLPVTIVDVEHAARRLDGVATRTGVVGSRTLDLRAGARVALKPEIFQRTGSFKFRGAYNRIARLSPEQLDAGVLAFSSGNHAQAVALAASLCGSHATIVMPADAPRIKLAATAAYGAEVITYARGREDREQIGRELAAERGLTIVPPFDDPQVIAGQGTVALELLRDAPGLDLLLVPVSGGGLVAGCAVVVASLSPATRVVGVEPEAGDDYRRSLEAGERIEVAPPQTIADALALTRPGEITFEINRRLLEGIVTVSDEELVQAMRFCHERLKLVVEPGGAAALAALLAGRAGLSRSGSVGIVLSGGNVDLERFSALLAP